MKVPVLLIITVLFSSCMKKTDVQLYDEGKALEEQSKFQDAAERYEEIVKRAPTSALSDSSLVRLAYLYSNEAKDVPKAIRSYQRYYEYFPASKRAPTMLFLSGFLFNNELHNTDSARAVYQTFLSKYPSHELASSAKFELETLGKDPNEALGATAIDTSGQKVAHKSHRQ